MPAGFKVFALLFLAPIALLSALSIAGCNEGKLKLDIYGLASGMLFLIATVSLCGAVFLLITG